MNKTEFLSAFLPKKNQWYRYAIWFLKDSWEAEEVIQDMYIKLWDHRKELKTFSKIDAYAFRMLKNLCIDRLRKSKINMVSIDHAVIENYETSDLEIVDFQELVSEIVSRLPEQQRLILQLRNVEGHSIDEIADVLDVKRNTVEVNLSRARKKVRKEVKKIF